MAKSEGDIPAGAAARDAESKPAEGADTVALMDPAAQLTAVVAERDQLVTENAELQDRLLRRMAEFDNFRRRVEREKAELRDLSAMEALRPMLAVLDDFERALAAGTSGQEFAKGMELIHQRLVAELQKLGLEPISTAGQKFDPHIHHALEMQAASGVEEHTILAELQKGYRFRGRLLRPAAVRVAVAPSQDKSADR